MLKQNFLTFIKFYIQLAELRQLSLYFAIQLLEKPKPISIISMFG